MILVELAVLAGTVGYSQASYAIESTELEAAMDLDPGMLKVEEQLFYDQFHKYDLVLESTLEYDFTKKWRLGIEAPVGKAERDNPLVGGALLHLKHVFNPDASTCVALGLDTIFPTGSHSHGIDEDVLLYLDQHLGKSERDHQLHLNLVETFVTDAHGNDRQFCYQAVVGYSFNLFPRTIFTADFLREQLDEHGKNSNVIEAGLKHEFTDTIAIAGGLGHGIGENSPEWQAQLGFEIMFGIAKK